MEGSEIILSLDYAVDDELKDEGHEVSVWSGLEPDKSTNSSIFLVSRMKTLK